MSQPYDITSHKKIWDLRRAGPVSKVNVYENDNGKPGKFLRVDPATRYDEAKRRAVELVEKS